MATNEAAQRQGLIVGMELAKAQAMIPDIDVRPFTPERDADDLDALAAWALLRYSPIVAADAPDGLVLDITGCAHLHSGEIGLMNDMLDSLRRRGISARMAIADSWGAAHALARYGRGNTVFATGTSRRSVQDLPVAALRLSDDIVYDLNLLGFDTIGELINQPRAPLIHRFGIRLGVCLDQALGDAVEPIVPVVVPDVLQVQRAFAEPIGAAETIARYTGKLTTQLCAALEDRALGARQLDLLFYRTDNRLEAIRIGTAAPVRDAKRLTRLLCDRIETIDPGFGIDRMMLTATLTEPFIVRQTDTQAPNVPELSGLIDILGNRFGAETLYRLAPVESDVPERSLRRAAPMTTVTATWDQAWPRPSRLFPHVEPIDTFSLLPDHAPRHFTWRKTRYSVRHADGPERIFGEWWLRDTEMHTVRDYFRVEDDEGRRFWIFRSGDGEHANSGNFRWYLHGIFA